MFISHSRKVLFFILVISIFQFNLEAQSSFYYTDGSKFKIIEYFINTGSLDLSYPLIKPYDINELKRELKQVNRQSRYYELLSDDLNSYKTGTEEVQSVFLKGEVKVNFESGQITKSRNGFKISANYPVGNFALKTSFQFDQNFKDDPTYSGELGEWYYGRFDEGYVNYSDTSLGVYAAYGRVQRNLGFYSSHSLILSDNPYSYDHLWLQYKNDLFSFSSIFARLEDKYGYDNRVKDSSSYGWYKRFFSLHRLDVNLTNNFKLALTEVVLYGGKNQQLLSYYLNPLVPFYISKTNERRSTDESDANIYLALDLWYKPFKNLTLYSQVFIDDIDFKAENRAKFPERKAIYGNVTVTDFVVPFSQFGVSYTWVENWTYTSFYTWANYNIHNRGIGFPFNSYQQVQFSFDYFGFNSMIISANIAYSEKGENSLENSFGATFEKFPMGTVEDILNLNLRATYFFAWNWISEIVLSYDNIGNHEHILSKTLNRFKCDFNLKVSF